MRLAIDDAVDYAVPVRLLGSGPIALRIIVYRAGAVIQEIGFTIPRPLDAPIWNA